MGSRIFTDKGVCRHSGKFLTDINNAYGFESINLLVKEVNDNDILFKYPKSISFPNKFIDYLVTGIITKEGKFIMDPTKYSYAEFVCDNRAKIEKNIVMIVILIILLVMFGRY